ncbi:hypothetical protein DK55_2095 [Brucella abortus bv. 2 str. 86/8/59]|nr:hypothetical protein DK55_2095 [Brucella abortus bv. 2 str. 86/8/59]
MARRIDEGDLLAVLYDLIGADMLRDAARFAGNDIGVADGVEKRGLAVVNVTHDGHDRRTRNHCGFVVGNVEDAFFHVRFSNALDSMAEFLGNELRGIGIDHVARLHHLALLHQVLDDVHGTLGHALCQFLKRDGFRNGDFTRNLLARFLHLRALEFFLTAAHRGKRARTALFLKIAREGELAATAIVFALHNLRCAHFRLCRDATAGCATAAIVVIVGLAGLAKLALRKRLASDRSGIGNNGGRTRAALLRPSGRLRATTLRAASLLRTCTIWCRARIVTALATGFRLRHTLGSFFLGFAARFSFRFQARFLFRLATGRFFTFLGAARIFLGAALGFLDSAGAFFHFADLRFFKRAAAGIHFGARQRVQHHAGTIRRARTLCLLAAGALMHRALLRDMRLRYRSRRGCGRLRCRGLYGCRLRGGSLCGRRRYWRRCRCLLRSSSRSCGLGRCRGFNFRLLIRAREFALLGFNDDSLRAAVAEILAHGALFDARPLQG